MSNVNKRVFDKKSSKNIKITIPTLISKNTQKMISKNEANNEVVNKKQVNDIVFNEKVHLVAEFKDFLILDDCSEFLKR